MTMSDPMHNLYAVIMAGGAGTRFWPASREKHPKQFLALGARADESLLEATVNRIAPMIPAARTFIATGRHLEAKTKALLPQLPPSNVLAEPLARNTAPCIGWATAAIQRIDPHAIIVVLPSDHVVADEDEFRRVLATATEAATQGFITTVGIVPTRPETGYGYIEKGAPISESIRRAARFTEKPPLAVAQSYLEDGTHLWNAGMFVFRADVMRHEIALHLPELATGLNVLDSAARQGREKSVLDEVFRRLPAVSIDHGVMEHAAQVAVVPGDFGWSDVGSWQTAWELAEKDEDGNAIPAHAITFDARGNLVRDLRRSTKGKTIALIGVTDLVIVETDDAILVLPRERAQDAKLAVQALKSAGKTELI
jgi:mannose-1-phosphate guanylyltransferase